MPPTAILPKDENEYKEWLTYLQTEKLPERLKSKQEQRKFKKRMSRFKVLHSRYLTFSNKLVVIDNYERKRDIIMEEHGEAHHHANATHRKIHEKYYGITKLNTKQVLDNCGTCKEHNHLKRMAVEWTPVDSDFPGRHFQADLIDLKKHSGKNQGMSFLLTYVCVYSRFLICIPLKTKTKPEVFQAFCTIFAFTGLPEIFHSDNGGEFENEILIPFLISNHIDVRHGKPLKPTTQGKIERVNQTIIRFLSKSLNLEQDQVMWLEKLNSVVWSYNSAPHSSHGKPPGDVFFNRKYHAPIVAGKFQKNQKGKLTKFIPKDPCCHWVIWRKRRLYLKTTRDEINSIIQTLQHYLSNDDENFKETAVKSVELMLTQCLLRQSTFESEHSRLYQEQRSKILLRKALRTNKFFDENYQKTVLHKNETNSRKQSKRKNVNQPKHTYKPGQRVLYRKIRGDNAANKRQKFNDPPNETGWHVQTITGDGKIIIQNETGEKQKVQQWEITRDPNNNYCLLYTSPSPRD